MVQTAAYTVEAFVADVNEIFASTKDALAQAQGVADHMETLLAEPDWLGQAIELPRKRGTAGLRSIWTRTRGTPATAGG